jgi:hypothetical protein
MSNIIGGRGRGIKRYAKGDEMDKKVIKDDEYLDIKVKKGKVTIEQKKEK